MKEKLKSDRVWSSIVLTQKLEHLHLDLYELCYKHFSDMFSPEQKEKLLEAYFIVADVKSEKSKEEREVLEELKCLIENEACTR